MDEIKTHTSATERINFTIWRNSSTHPFSDVLFADGGGSGGVVEWTSHDNREKSHDIII